MQHLVIDTSDTSSISPKSEKIKTNKRAVYPRDIITEDTLRACEVGKSKFQIFDPNFPGLKLRVRTHSRAFQRRALRFSFEYERRWIGKSGGNTYDIHILDGVCPKGKGEGEMAGEGRRQKRVAKSTGRGRTWQRLAATGAGGGGWQSVEGSGADQWHDGGNPGF